MLKKEIIGVFKEKKLWLFFVIMLMITIVDLKSVCDRDDVWYKRNNKQEILESDVKLKEICLKEGYNFTSGWIIHPAKAAYLSGSSEGHLTQMLLLWLMPIYVLSYYCDKYILEKKKLYTNGIIARTSRIKYMMSKYVTSFLVPCVMFFLCLIVNFIVAQIIFRDGYNFCGMEHQVERGTWFKFMYANPNIAYLLYSLLTSIVVGLCGIICQSIALLTKKYAITYVASFFIWMVFIMMKYSITYAMQPFTEYGLNYMLTGIGIVFFCTSIIFTVSLLRLRRRDEL